MELVGELGLLAVAFLIILAGAELFTNGIEWFGRKLELAEGAVGSVLAAVGTATGAGPPPPDSIKGTITAGSSKVKIGG